MLRVTLAGTAWLALLTQLWLALSGAAASGEGMFAGLVDYFGYFTILTNGFCALVVTAHLRAGRADAPLRFFRRAGVATAAAAAIIIVAVVYHLLLSDVWDPRGLQLVVDILLHSLVPIGFLFFWYNTVPRGALALRDVPRWLVYPVGYALYVFGRGPLVGEYPYFFIDVNTLGLTIALRNAALVTLAFSVIAAALVGVNRFAGHVRPEDH